MTSWLSMLHGEEKQPLGLCNNIGNCSIADKKKEIPIRGDNEKCPECGANIAPKVYPPPPIPRPLIISALLIFGLMVLIFFSQMIWCTINGTFKSVSFFPPSVTCKPSSASPEEKNKLKELESEIDKLKIRMEKIDSEVNLLVEKNPKSIQIDTISETAKLLNNELTSTQKNITEIKDNIKNQNLDGLTSKLDEIKAIVNNIKIRVEKLFNKIEQYKTALALQDLKKLFQRNIDNKNWSEASENIKNIHNLDPDPALLADLTEQLKNAQLNWYQQQAIAAIETGDMDVAEKHIIAMEQLEPNWPTLAGLKLRLDKTYKLAKLNQLITQGDWNKAKQYLNELHQLHPSWKVKLIELEIKLNDTQNHQDMANKMLNKADWNEAKKHLDKLRDADIDSVVLMNLLDTLTKGEQYQKQTINLLKELDCDNAEIKKNQLAKISPKAIEILDTFSRQIQQCQHTPKCLASVPKNIHGVLPMYHIPVFDKKPVPQSVSYWMPKMKGKIINNNKNFFIMRREVTVQEFQQYVETLTKIKQEQQFIPTGWKQQADYPVSHISWEAAQGYANWLSEKTGNNCIIKLPSEKQWRSALAYIGLKNVEFRKINDWNEPVKLKKSLTPKAVVHLFDNLTEWSSDSCLNGYNVLGQNYQVRERALANGHSSVTCSNAKESPILGFRLVIQE
ncbi:SUMF1/EgtB/PvdO family nonheme iron enzyme [Candidatus Venteria ishoeyi]|uniref:SUMF1/EgtB/PvdO family nonheme iron enzyme n=1 Tax=Candidatus Venteria ishoeyi TaxID=1899563 RepID=UPI0025A5BF3A|nr:SUMF1/EgtB/PvdO family nonheme iron enzyme [Candidatus Venteria ishoeyi]MDM8548311.1 SUMF1/EgtB/PvdO family nonheme iron enzyme [Candidatus Venteria ishoeyi]